MLYFVDVSKISSKEAIPSPINGGSEGAQGAMPPVNCLPPCASQ